MKNNHVENEIKFIPLGGADEIGASCFYINICGTGIMLDCGIHPRKKGFDAIPKFELLENLPLDYVFISHAHQDHIGGLPFLIKKFPHVIIYTTVQTKEIAEITLHNAANIIAKDVFDDPDFNIYTHEEIDLLVRSIRDVNYNEVISISGMRHTDSEALQISFHDAGHILGSAGIHIQFKDEKIFYTGDINLSDQSIMKGTGLKGVHNIDSLILESTYGAADSDKLGSWNSELNRFASGIGKVLNGGGSVLIPVFALGKTQEILSSVYKLMLKRKLPETNIYTGGIGKNISGIYDKNRYKVTVNDPNFELSDIPQINLFDIDDLNEFKKNPGIVLASSGMMIEGTASYKLLDFWLRQKNFAVFGVGYMDPETTGYKIMNSKTGDKIQLNENSESIKIKCGINRFYFPSHSKREDLIRVVKKTNPKKVILIHGDKEAQDWMGYNILHSYPHIKLYAAEPSKEIHL